MRQHKENPSRLVSAVHELRQSPNQPLRVKKMLLKSSDPPLATSSSTDLENSSQNNNLGSLQRKAISSTSLTSSHLKKFVSRIDARKFWF
ncbi:hypothetical protein PGTUg99_012814 [Puccinia graminis f. sp. tritici]|uniref:Uncharacterized protein n=1 Tax=Puccinia graminis f. sp. tritici TaxID=56615 RepID=A0A5B0NIM5_PUCGR|nr:hypothetical protein PGTUg99_012814 [Puccinia graminis f. sp. tritici]